MAVFYKSAQKTKKSFFSSLSVNSVLIIINISLFILFTILLSTKIISIDSVAIKPENIFQGKYIWTFLTSMFMHGGFWHLFVNMFSLILLAH